MSLDQNPRYHALVNSCKRFNILVTSHPASTTAEGHEIPASLTLVKPGIFQVYQEDIEHASAWLNGYAQAFSETLKQRANHAQ
jgi:hypothetical protein